MLKSISKLRNKRKKKGKEKIDKNDNKGQTRTGEIDALNLLGPPPLPPLNSEGGDFKRNSSENSIPTMGDCSSISECEEFEEINRPEDIKADNLFETYNRNHADEDRLFLAEFQLLQRLVAKQNPTCEHAKLPVNSHKNRYKNIIACDNHRVKLSIMDGDENSDYINASYINGYSVSNKFIASQGPKESTLNDFWRMIWEQKCFVIVMITELRELGRQKCEQYWPEEEEGTLQFGDFSVDFVQTKQYGSFIKRELKLCRAEETRLISQFQYRAWPDHGVPRTTTALFRFREITLNAQPPDGGPVLVHCSAGVGRTGTYIALDVLLDQLNDTGKINVFELILEFRLRRAEMVQSLDQYSFIHKLVYEYYVLGDTDVKRDDFEELYQTLSSDEGSGFDSSFKLLESSQMTTSRLGSGALERNKDKNRDESIVPYEHSQVFIRMRPHEQLPLYFNASSIQSYDINANVILSQAPMQNTIEDMWRLVVDNNVVCIAMLCQFGNEESGDSAEYLPTATNPILDLGEIVVRNESTTQINDVVKTVVMVEYKDREKVSRKITHWRHQTWVDENVLSPQGVSTVIEMIKLVADYPVVESGAMKPRVLVHCSDGAGRSGVFCAAANSIERLKNEGRVDILRTVKDLRDSRPCVVRTKEQYKICFDIIREYLKMDETKPAESEEIVAEIEEEKVVNEMPETDPEIKENEDREEIIVEVEEEKVVNKSNPEIKENQDREEIIEKYVQPTMPCEDSLEILNENQPELDEKPLEISNEKSLEDYLPDAWESEPDTLTGSSTEIFISIDRNDIVSDTDNHTANEFTENGESKPENEFTNVKTDSKSSQSEAETKPCDNYNSEINDNQNFISNDNAATQEIFV